jgi:hypothetical protein
LNIIVLFFEFIAWFAVLGMAPLITIFPFMALSNCGVVVAGRFNSANRCRSNDGSPLSQSLSA